MTVKFAVGQPAFRDIASQHRTVPAGRFAFSRARSMEEARTAALQGVDWIAMVVSSDRATDLHRYGPRGRGDLHRPL
jgi:hypothetical protein